MNREMSNTRKVGVLTGIALSEDLRKVICVLQRSFPHLGLERKLDLLAGFSHWRELEEVASHYNLRGSSSDRLEAGTSEISEIGWYPLT